MRRSLIVLLLSVICLAISPARADAWFWRWIDDLSGPQFQGLSLEAKLVCFGQGSGARTRMLEAVERHLYAERAIYRRHAAVHDGREALFHKIAEGLTEEASTRIRELLSAGDPDKDAANKALARVMSLRLHARVASDARVDGNLNPKLFAQLRQWLDELEQDYAQLAVAHNLMLEGGASSFTSTQARRLVTTSLASVDKAVGLLIFGTPVPILSGGRLSVCKFSYFDVDRFFLSANVGYGWDTKPENQGKGLKMVTVGGSAHWTIVPALTVGAGTGNARFFTRASSGTLSRTYIDIPIIEVKPLTLFLWNPRFHSPWAHTLYLRYTGTFIRGGFEENDFYDGSPPYEGPEYINSVGLFFDAEPLLRRWRGKWWRDKP